MVAVTVVTAVALGGTFAGVSYVFNRQQREEFDAELRAVARQEAREAPGLGFSFTDGPGPAANDVGPLTKQGLIFGQRGEILATTPPFDGEPPPRHLFRSPCWTCFDFVWHQQRLRAVLVPIPGAPGRELFLAASRDDLDGDEQFLNRAMTAAFLLALLWVGVVTHWAVGRLIIDHERVAEVARRIARGDLSARVSSSSSDAELLQLGRDIDTMIDTIEQLLATRDRFVAHAAHELRSPLTRLYGELQQAVRKERDAQGYRDAITRAIPAARHLTLLVEDLLLLARIRHERAPERSWVALSGCLQDASAFLLGDARERSVACLLPETSAQVFGHPRDLTRLFRNLLENAIAHAPEGSCVEVFVGEDPGQVWIDVTDAGEGVPDQDRERIFEAFYRSRSSSPMPHGAGLGLGLARDIARAHGGELALMPAAHRPGFTCFRVTLPAR